MREKVEGEARERWRGRRGGLGEEKEAEKREREESRINPMKGSPPLLIIITFIRVSPWCVARGPIGLS